MSYLSNKRLFNKYKIYLLPFVIVLVVLYLWTYFLQPKISDIVTARQELAKGQKRLADLTKKAVELQNFDNPELKEKFAVLDSAVPSEKDIAGFLLGIQRIANEASVSVGLIEVAPGLVSTGSAEKKPQQDQPVTAKVTIKGTFPAIRDFISKTIQARRLIKIDGLSLSGSVAQKADQPISLALSVSIYFQPLPTSLGAISAPLENFTPEEEELYQRIKTYTYYSYFQSGPLPEAVQSGGVIPVGKVDLFNP
ncbi:type 4a pilus biogenesis protein PilO [Candidatus Microgenomates bacterium]|nr:type 4a pilus biogenesis protein PilO [Candidatus Microgenomates bacterium]